MTAQRKPSRVVKSTIVLIGVLSLTIFAWWAWTHQEAARTQPAFKFTQVSRGKLEVLVTSTGTLAAVETVEIGTQASGTIEKLLVDYNDQVKKGQVLALLDQASFIASVNKAKADVLKAQAELKQAEDELHRNAPLFDKGYISEQEFLPITTAVDTTKASLQSAKASLEQAQINLDHTVIRSPIDGTVIDRSVDAGQTVAASLSTPTLFLIAEDLSRMQIETQVDETDIGQIRQGQAVRFTVQSYFDQDFTGSVRQIRLQPETVDNVVTYTVIVDADNASGQLMPGMTATVDFVVYQSENALLVPVAALNFTPDPKRKSNDGSQIFIHQDDGPLRPIRVTAKESDGLLTEIVADELDAGMQVAIGMKPAGEESEKEGFSLFNFMRQGQRGRSSPGQGSGGGPRP
ncbi:HlyD family secretion protein [Desulfuromusa kysingii]|uniref:HlyD family secretion protein n=1 Tax=Desulfuromusa kysingii TaxID=37625 RepID=A0A1H4DYH4_9BACT|nr:efflux RND transporter periplasmic adaptor subunit [Desulfuromusa kysingii]SEA77558.1 HlyD family secretion protein [Desulfuromusa kysingii]